MLCEAGLEHNRSRFIVKRIFGEEFVVVRRDPSKVQFIARLNDFYFQFQKLGNNYNQIVKAINAYFSNIAIPHQIAMLEQRTRKLKASVSRFSTSQNRLRNGCEYKIGLLARWSVILQ